MTAGRGVTLERGVFIISIDTELAWGCFDRPDREARWAMEERSREVISRLLELFARYSVPATWAVVGHLFLDRCAPGECPHAEIPRPRHTWFEGDWYRFDPCTDLERDPLWYGADIIRQLRAAAPAQEIASHSFSHPIFGDAGCSGEAADADIAACVRAAQAWDVRLQSFVYPRNRIAHREALGRHGFSCYRGPDPAWFAGLPRLAKRAAHYLDDLLALPPPTVLPNREGALWNIPGSVMLQGMDGARNFIPAGCRTRRGVSGVRRAAARKEIFHLWFHPINFSVRMEAMLKALEPVLAEAARLRGRGELDVKTMGQLAAELPAN